MQYRFMQVDVFTAVPFLGNPVAVVLDAGELDTAAMQRIARWTNLSETTFVLPPTVPEADYRVRIFTPNGELPFAGHPTLGTAHAVAHSKGLATETLTQECAAGLVALRRLSDTHSGWSLRLPPGSLSPISEADEQAVAAALDLPLASRNTTRIVDLGPRWLTCEVACHTALLDTKPDFASIETLSQRLKITGINVFAAAHGASHDYELRTFAPAFGVPEDPVCGSGNGAVAQLLADAGRLTAGHTPPAGPCHGT